MNLLFMKIKGGSGRANVIRLLLIFAFLAFAFLAYRKFMFKACVSIQFPAESHEKSFRKIIPAAEFKLMQSYDIIKSGLKNVFHLNGTREVKLENGIIDKIKGNLDYKFDNEAMVFELHYYDRSKDYASNIANAIAESYSLDYSSKLNDNSSKSFQLLYMKQLEYEKMLSAVNARYEKFCAEENIVNIDNDYSVLSNQYVQYSNELSKIQTEMNITEKLAEKNFTFKAGHAANASIAAGENPAAQAIEESEDNYEIKKKIRESEIKLAMLKKKYTDAHPLVKNESVYLEILKNKLTYKPDKIEQQAAVIKPVTQKGKADYALELLKTRKKAYDQLMDECEKQLKAYPKKKMQLKAYEVEISKFEKMLSATNKQIEEARVSQSALVDNMPRIIELSNSASVNINVPVIEIISVLFTFILFVLSFKVEYKVQTIQETKKVSSYKSVVSEELKMKVLGHINKAEPFNFEDSSFSAKCFAYHQKDSKQAKYINTIRNGIVNQLDRNTTNVIAVTSLNPGEGKTIIAANIGISSSMAGQPTLVADFNYKTTSVSLSEHYKVKSDYGLTDIIIGETSYKEVISKTAIDELYVISTGVLPPNVQKVMSSPVCGNFLKEVSEKFGLVITDCPAFSISTDFHAIANYVKNVALVVDVEKINSIEDFKEELIAFEDYARSANLYVLGVIFNEK